ncbi:copper chaperone PCu(A)C [Microbacterium istanbulense]|uniref:Copper chaperone PCu(A)C n=1 Tax=Microbacterium istanbulense TaxID=3122049 RepID=A0ABU8LFZ0_9MICO
MSTRSTVRSTSIRVTALLAVATLGLAGCTAADAETPAPAASAPAADAITLDDAWVKSAEEGMTAAFGVLINEADTDVTLVAASTTAAGMTELHETTADDSGAMVMREVEDGFTIPAAGDFALEPGANHLMLMELAAPLLAGDEVTVTLEFSDGSTLDVTAPVKDFTGAEEEYEGDHEGMEH